MKSQYKNAPLQEALIEVTFASEQEWDPAIPGLLYGRIQDEYPERKSAMTVGVLIQQEGDDFSPKVERQLRSQFWNKAMNATVQVSPNQLVVNRLRPYDSWSEFLARFQRAYSEFTKITNYSDIELIRVQCLNRPELQIDNSNLGKYLTVGPCHASKPLSQFRSFLWGIELIKEDNSRLRVEAASYAESQETPFKVRLDLTIESAKRRSIDWGNLVHWLEFAHIELVNAFEASITADAQIEFEKI